MIYKIRNIFGKLIIRLLLLMIAISFVFWGFNDIFSSDKSSYVAKIFNRKITTQEFNVNYQRERQRIKEIFGNSIELNHDRIVKIRNYVLGNMINKEILSYKAKNNHIAISDDAIFDHIKNYPIFLDEKNKFSISKFKNFLASNKLREREFVNQVKDDLTSHILLSSLTSKNFIDDNMVSLIEQFYDMEYDIDIFKLNINDIPFVAKDKSELHKFYKENEALFLSDELRDFSEIRISKSDLKKSIKVSEKEIAEEYKLRNYKEYKESIDVLRPKITEQLVNAKLEAMIENLLSEIEDMIASGANLKEISEKLQIPLKHTKNTSRSLMRRNHYNRDLIDIIFNDVEGDEPKIFHSDLEDNISIVKVTLITKPYVLSFAKAEAKVKKLYKEKYLEEALRKFYSEGIEDSRLIFDIKNYKLNYEQALKELGLLIPENMLDEIFALSPNDRTRIYNAPGNIRYFAQLNAISKKTTDNLERKNKIRAQLVEDYKNELIWSYLEHAKRTNKLYINYNILNNKRDDISY